MTRHREPATDPAASSSTEGGEGSSPPDAERPRARLTHVALRTTDMDASIDFYRRYAGFQIAHSRKDDGIRVVWVAEDPDDPTFVIVLMEMPHSVAMDPSPSDHLGFATASREDVDRIADLARGEGRLKLEPRDLGAVAGYLTLIRDPSGNTCEFSYGQQIRAPGSEH